MISTHVTYTTHYFHKNQNNESLRYIIKKILDFLKIGSKLSSVGARVRPTKNLTSRFKEDYYVN